MLPNWHLAGLSAAMTARLTLHVEFVTTDPPTRDWAAKLAKTPAYSISAP